MPAFLITSFDITDPEAYARYQQATVHTIDEYGIKVRAMTDQVDIIEGDLAGSRLGVLEFKDVETLKAWYNSPDYQSKNELRHAGTDINFMVCLEVGDQ